MKSIKNIKLVLVRGYHGYRSFGYAFLINSGLLVFLRLIFDQEVCFGVGKSSWLGIF